MFSNTSEVIIPTAMYHLGFIATNYNNNSKFLAAAILVVFDKLYLKRIPYTPIRDLTSLQHRCCGSFKFVKHYAM
jgi:hypothetical protein